MFEPETD